MAYVADCRILSELSDLLINNVVNITSGFNAQRNGTLCHKKLQWEPKP
jgi:hypothetical protein